MAFTHAIYYPWINIDDSGWLKSAILYWDKISTIVPEYMEMPYTSPDCVYLNQAGILLPEYVESMHPSVRETSSIFLDYISTPEAETILLPNGVKNLRLPYIAQVTELAKLNKFKIGRELAQKLIESGKVIEDGEWLLLDKQSADYYMTLLAANLSFYKHLAPLTNEWPYQSLVNKAKRGDNPKIRNQGLGEALLAQLTLEVVNISPDTPIESILTFRDDYKDEIGKFRSEIGKLSKQFQSENPSLDALKQQVSDIYVNDISPAINDLKKALNSKRIRTFRTHLSSIIFAGSLSFLEPNSTLNLATFAGCEIVGNTINYLIDRKRDLNANPYSFILFAQDQLS